MKTRLVKYLNLSILLLVVPAAWAETVNCTPITALPTVITSQGVYCLTGNLKTSMTSGNAIEIQANNVTIDLNGWKLGGLPAGIGTTANGIYAWKRKKITIRNGTIRGFYQGILLDDSSLSVSQGHLIEDIRADRNTFVGMNILGRDDIVRRNRVVDTGGSTVNGSATGIQLKGPGVRALSNDISGTAATPAGFGGYGLRLLSVDGAVVEGNRIDNVSAGSGITRGISIDNSNDVLAAGNRITRAYYGIYYDRSTGKYMDNLTSNVTIPFTGGTPVGTNN